MPRSRNALHAQATFGLVYTQGRGHVWQGRWHRHAKRLSEEVDILCRKRHSNSNFFVDVSRSALESLPGIGAIAFVKQLNLAMPQTGICDLILAWDVGVSVLKTS